MDLRSVKEWTMLSWFLRGLQDVARVNIHLERKPIWISESVFGKSGLQFHRQYASTSICCLWKT